MTKKLDVRVHLLVPANRDYVGELRVWDGAGALLLGPARVAARASDEIAAEHGNPTRATTLPFGDAPLGSYRFERLAETGLSTKYRSDLFGALDAVVLSGRDGDAALADANGRFEFLIHGGPLTADGALRATTGHFRISDDDLERLTELLAAAGRVTVACEEVARPSQAEMVEDRRGGDTGALEAFTPRPVYAAAVPSAHDLVAYGEYVPIDQTAAAQVGYYSESVANDYATRGVTYQMGGDGANGGTTSDCSHFVNDVLRQSGLDIPYTTTGDMASSPHFEAVAAAQAQAGDVIVQGGHMGVYSGTSDAAGHPIGTQMGNHAVAEAPWGPGGWFANGGGITFYRPKH